MPTSCTEMFSLETKLPWLVYDCILNFNVILPIKLPCFFSEIGVSVMLQAVSTTILGTRAAIFSVLELQALVNLFFGWRHTVFLSDVPFYR
jgi:hypothetical protein